MTGIVLGIVVQNNDPQKRGRVKIFIPSLSLNLYENWDNENANKSFTDLSDPLIKDVVDKIKNQLPWANCAAPVFGEVGSGYYDSAGKKTKVGDNPDRESDKPAKAIEDNPPRDAFYDGETNKFEYEHDSYSNTSKGLFSIPRVGSKVWVFFENGNLNRPVYFATSYDKEDWVNIEDENYPDDFENIYGAIGETSYKNKMAISQRGGVIEIVNTDNKESIQISHYNGGFKILNNGGSTEYVEGTDRKLVSAGQFETVTNDSSKVIKKNLNVTVNENKNETVNKNVNLTIGENFNIDVDKNVNINILGASNIYVKENCDITCDKTISFFTGEKFKINP